MENIQSNTIEKVKKPKLTECEILFRENGSKITDFKAQGNFETTFYTENGVVNIQYKQWE